MGSFEEPFGQTTTNEVEDENLLENTLDLLENRTNQEPINPVVSSIPWNSLVNPEIPQDEM